MDKKAKAEAKRTRRLKRKQGDDANNLPVAEDGQPNKPDAEPDTLNAAN